MGRLFVEAMVMVALLSIGLLTLIASAMSLFLLSAFIGSGGREAGEPLLLRIVRIRALRPQLPRPESARLRSLDRHRA